MHEPDNYIRYLNAGVVNVVLNFHPFTSSLENSYKGVAQNGIAYVTDVRRFVGIDAGVFDHLFRPIWDGGAFGIRRAFRSEQG